MKNAKEEEVERYVCVCLWAGGGTVERLGVGDE